MTRTIAILLSLSLSLMLSCAAKEAVKAEKEALQEVEKLVLPEPPEPAKKPEPETPKKPSDSARVEEEGKFIILNFDGADIETVISTFGELLNINYILAPGISGKVTIQSSKKFPTKDLFHIFQTILEINGLSAVKDGPLYRIVPIDTVKQHPVDVEQGKELKLRLDSSFVTQLMPLEYVKASEIANILRTLAPRGADLIIYEPSNLLIITALPPTLTKFMKLIEAIDVPDAEREAIKTFVYYVENGEAKKLEGILKSIYAEKKGAAVTTRTTTAAPGLPSPVRAAGGEGFAGEIGEVSITAYEDINALIIKATPRGYLALLELLRKIDVPVKQVLIEVIVASYTFNDSAGFGVEWFLRNSRSRFPNAGGFVAPPAGSSPPNISLVNGVMATSLPSGFSGFVSGIVDSTAFSAVVSSLTSTGRFNVLASPHILAMDNKEARIEIGREVPIATGLTQQPATGAGTSLVTTGQVQYKTVGTLLTVTPHITEKNKVTLKISQEISSVEGTEQDVSVVQTTSPTFTKKKAETIAVVQSGHTLVLGGLIEENKNKERTGIPFLSKIPILGYLFGTTSESLNKTEFILMVTPHVVSNQEEADMLTEDFKNKVKTIKKRLEKMKKDGEEEKPASGKEDT